MPPAGEVKPLRSAEELNRRYFRDAYETGVHGWQSAEASPFAADHLAAVARAAPDAWLLDLGCGEGRHCLLAAEMGLLATGVDYEPLAISRAVENLRRAGCEKRVQLLVADLFALPFRRHLFDALLDYGCLHHQPKADWRRYVAAVKAVLRPRGWFVLTVFSTRFTVFGRQARRWHLAHGAYRRFFTAGDLQDLFAEDFDFIRMTEERDGPRGFWHVLMQRKARV
jgi:cyclopropane fatty-acyl-phospholipid synthase-like methyltransferase